jgi:hypothetical protein
MFISNVFQVDLDPDHLRTEGVLARALIVLDNQSLLINRRTEILLEIDRGIDQVVIRNTSDLILPRDLHTRGIIPKLKTIVEADLLQDLLPEGVTLDMLRREIEDGATFDMLRQEIVGGAPAPTGINNGASLRNQISLLLKTKHLELASLNDSLVRIETLLVLHVVEMTMIITLLIQTGSGVVRMNTYLILLITSLPCLNMHVLAQLTVMYMNLRKVV